MMCDGRKVRLGQVGAAAVDGRGENARRCWPVGEVDDGRRQQVVGGLLEGCVRALEQLVDPA